MNRTVMMQKVRDADNFVVLFKDIFQPADVMTEAARRWCAVHTYPIPVFISECIMRYGLYCGIDLTEWNTPSMFKSHLPIEGTEFEQEWFELDIDSAEREYVDSFLRKIERVTFTEISKRKDFLLFGECVREYEQSSFFGNIMKSVFEQ